MKFYVSTPIYYVNAEPHIGHTYSTLVADTITRFHKLLGDDAFFSTGTDEHGEKIVEAAGKIGYSPKEYADRISDIFRSTWPKLNVEPKFFIRTTDPGHIRAVQFLLNKVYASGDIYFGEYSGLYCTGCERFYLERELVSGKCPDHKVPPVLVKEENYFFRMSRYQDWLIEHIKKNSDFIKPERFRNEVLSFLSEPLEDLCISRPRSRLAWGIPLPFDDRFVTYVWFDALINYISVLGYPDGPVFKEFWRGEHIIAKDILKPHAIYWPTMLKAAEIEPYKALHVHGYWIVNESKMSKSLGNVVRPLDLVSTYGVDTVRYFLLREMVFGLDASFSEEALIARRNSDLANDLGNLISRSLTMVEKYCGGVIPEFGIMQEIDCALKDNCVKTADNYSRDLNDFAFHKALADIWEVINHANKYIVQTSPWELAKEEADRERLNSVLYNLMEAVRCITVWLLPFMPETAAEMAKSLGYSETACLQFSDTRKWGLLKPGQKTRKGPALFPRINLGKAPDEKHLKLEKVEISQEFLELMDFKKLDLRIGEVLSAEPVPKSEKLIKLRVAADRERTVVAGIAKDYKPDDLLGKKVVILINLKPAVLMGVKSEGMLLAAHDESGIHVLTIDGQTIPGSKIS